MVALLGITGFQLAHPMVDFAANLRVWPGPGFEGLFPSRLDFRRAVFEFP